MKQPISSATCAILCTLAAGPSLSAYVSPKDPRAVTPSVKSSRLIGNVDDPTINRDSCGSIRVGARNFWTCRDSQGFNADGRPILPIWASSAAWTDIDPGTGTPETRMYAQSTNQKPYFPIPADECGANVAGDCANGTRYAIWPDLPPMIVPGPIMGQFVAYTWIRNSYITNDLAVLVPDPSTALYKLVGSYDSGFDKNALPAVALLDEHFWAAGEVSYGNYGNVVKDGTAYLWGQHSNKNVFLAKVPSNAVEDKSQYQYWINGSWTAGGPARPDDSSSSVAASSAGGQGNYFYSDYFDSFAWVGQGGFPAADFYMTLAPEPTGPWTQQVMFYSGEGGNDSIPAYSLQAHPGMSAAGSNTLYLSYTKSDTDRYSTPLVQVVFN